MPAVCTLPSGPAQSTAPSRRPPPPPAQPACHCKHVAVEMLHTGCYCFIRSFDFDADERWQSYRQRLELPAGSDEAALLQRMKRKWYRREIDPTLDAAQGSSVLSLRLPCKHAPRASATRATRTRCAAEGPSSATDVSQGTGHSAAPPPPSSPPPARPPPPLPAASPLPVVFLKEAWGWVSALFAQLVGRVSGTAAGGDGSGATGGTGARVRMPLRSQISRHARQQPVVRSRWPRLARVCI